MAPHYWAGGERHALEPAADWLAIDTRAADEAGLGREVAALPVGSTLPSGMIFVERADCDDDLCTRLSAAGAAREAYRSGRALVVLMPEVRLEIDEGRDGDALRAVEASGVPAEITDEGSGRMTLRPRSGKGEDALDLANYLHKHLRPAASSVRMLQVVPKPPRNR